MEEGEIRERKTSPSSEVSLLRATYTWPGAKDAPASMTAFSNVRPWLLWMVIAQARRIGYWEKLPNSSS